MICDDVTDIALVVHEITCCVMKKTEILIISLHRMEKLCKSTFSYTNFPTSFTNKFSQPSRASHLSSQTVYAFMPSCARLFPFFFCCVYGCLLLVSCFHEQEDIDIELQYLFVFLSAPFFSPRQTNHVSNIHDRDASSNS